MLVNWLNGQPPSNVWLGVSVESRAYLGRIDILRQTPAAVRFVSAEPLLEDLGDLDLTGIHWLIAGGESGHNARRCDVAWVRSIVEQCRAAGTACFVKQLGGRPQAVHHPLNRPLTATGLDDTTGSYNVLLRDPKGGNIEEWPEDIRVRQFPKGGAV